MNSSQENAALTKEPEDSPPPVVVSEKKTKEQKKEEEEEEKKRKEKEEQKKKGDEAQAKALQQFTGEGFMEYSKLVNITTQYQNKEKAEDVDAIEQLGLDHIFEKLRTSPENGIDNSTIQERLKAFGTNKPPKTRIKGFIILFFEALNDFTLIILMIAALISIVVNLITEEDHRYIAWIDGCAILGAVFLCAGVAAFQDSQTEKQFADLNRIAEAGKKAEVIRNGKTEQIHPSDLLVGDIVMVKSGDEIPGDALLLKGSSVMCDEAAMTGESDALGKDCFQACIEVRNKVQSEGKYASAHKHDFPSPLMLSGTSIKNGNGSMMIIAVGTASSIGKIRATLADKEDDETPLQKKLTKIANDIGYFGFFAGTVTLLIMVARAIYEWADTGNFGSSQTRLIINGFLVGITVLVVAIPEGLPLAVTISLSYSVKKMLQDENLVRKFHACETMGSATYVCSDKTGTLTLNQMYMIKFWNLDVQETYEETETRLPSGKTELKRAPLNYNTWVVEKMKNLFELALTVNSMTDPTVEEGNPTDLAITRYMYLNGEGVNAVEMLKKYPKIMEEPFSSDRKRMSAFIKDDEGRHMIVMKGASELVLDSCKNIIDLKSGDLIDIDDAVKQDVTDAIENFAKTALRTIAVCIKYTDSYDKNKKDRNGVLDDEASGFTLVGIAGIRDVIRTEVPDAVRVCKQAGIQVKMVTGDNKVTAKAIAMECNIIAKDGSDEKPNTVMLGSEFYEYIGGLDITEVKGKKKYSIKNKERFKEIYHDVQVLARSRPEDKLAMVIGLKENGNVVAVTGDGTNDAPALSKANVGFAMGKTGTEIAKQAADILLTQDNFVSIVSAVKWGRNIFDSIRKFLQFQLTVNVVAVGITFIAAAVTQQPVLQPIQMLWVNLIMDTLASLALATEPPTELLLMRPPNALNDYIVNKMMFKHIFAQAIYQFCVLLAVTFSGHYWLPEEWYPMQHGAYRPETGPLDGYDKPSREWLFGLYCVRSGLLIYDVEYEEPLKTDSRHFTFIFHIFVMMQIFNFINARKIDDSFNTFKGICNSPLFIIIVTFIFILQALIVSFGYVVFKVALFGVGPIGWVISLLFGSFGMIVNLITKPIPHDIIFFCCRSSVKPSNKQVKRRSFRSLSLRSMPSLRGKGNQQ